MGCSVVCSLNMTTIKKKRTTTAYVKNISKEKENSNNTNMSFRDCINHTQRIMALRNAT